MESKNSNAVSVYIANLGRYNEGILQGGWIDLPVPQQELDRFLREKVGIELDADAAFEKGLRGERVYEEYAIHDFDYDKGLAAIGYKPHEYTNLEDLNLLAAALSNLNETQLEAVRLCAEDVVTDEDALIYANLAVQADEIPYYSFNFEGIEYSDNMSAEEKLGYTLLDGSPTQELLEENDLMEFFDVEKYGESHSYNCTLADDGYLDNAADYPDTEFYDRDELKEIAAEIMEAPDFFGRKEEQTEPGQKHPEQSCPSLSDRSQKARNAAGNDRGINEPINHDIELR